MNPFYSVTYNDIDDNKLNDINEKIYQISNNILNNFSYSSFTMNLSKLSVDKELLSKTNVKDNTMNLSERSSPDKELLSGELCSKDNTITIDQNKIILEENNEDCYDNLNYNINKYNTYNTYNTYNKYNKYNKLCIIKKANFYIKKNKKIKIYNTECPICYNGILIEDSKYFDCNHMLCKCCHTNWKDECIKKNIEFHCPLCRR